MSLENSYDFLSDGINNIPTGFTVNNAYNAFFKSPPIGDKKIAIYGDNFLIGFKGVQPPTDGGYIMGRLGIGHTTADVSLDVNGSIRHIGEVSTSELISESTSLSQMHDSIIDSRNGSLSLYLEDPIMPDQIKTVRLLTNRSLSSIVRLNAGSFNLTPSQPYAKLRSTSTGWNIESRNDNSNSFFVVDYISTLSGTRGFGSSVALSADGLTLAVGKLVSNLSLGGANIYTRKSLSVITWTLQQSLLGTGNTGFSTQGESIALSADGNVMAIGGGGDTSSMGATWVFKRVGNTWTQDGTKLVGSGGSGSRQGTGMSLSADGNTLAIGGREDSNGIGSTWVFKYSQGSWAQLDSIMVGSDYTGAAKQGVTVALSADGNTLAVGGPEDDESIGAVWIWELVNGSFVQKNILKGTGETGAGLFGCSVSLSADGNTLAVGGKGDNTNVGAVWVYQKSYGTWSLQNEKLVGYEYNGASKQGAVVALSSDGNTLISFGPEDDLNVGAIWVFIRNGYSWKQQGTKLITPDGNNTLASAAINANGSCVVVGSYAYDNDYAGNIWTFM